MAVCVRVVGHSEVADPHSRAELAGQAQIPLIPWPVLPQLSAERSRDAIPPRQSKGIPQDCRGAVDGTIQKPAEFEPRSFQ